MAVSIKDIARRAGVAPSTVSRALKDHRDIGPDTKERIGALAREMGYVPSEAARNLVAGRSGTIGICIPELANPSFAEQARAVDDAASENGYQVLVTPFYKLEERELACVRTFQERRVDGIIIPASVAYRGYRGTSGNLFTPIVVINRTAYPHSVNTDREAGARLLVTHLLEYGHRRIAYVRAPDAESDAPRLAGYRRALAEYGIPLDDALLFQGNDQISGGIRAAQRMLELPSPPTAMFAFNDITAIGVIHGLRELGYRVPHDVSVAGYDNLEIAAHYYPRLTTVEQPNYELGRRAFAMLLAMITGEAPEAPLVLPPKLIIGDSTGPPPTVPDRTAVQSPSVSRQPAREGG